jgi:hypothetical protein
MNIEINIIINSPSENAGRFPGERFRVSSS